MAKECVLNKIVLQKLTGRQLDKNFQAIYGWGYPTKGCPMWFWTQLFHSRCHAMYAV